MVLRGKHRLILVTIAISLGGSFHYGYQSASLNPSERVFRRFINGSYFNHYGWYMDDETYRATWSLVTSLCLFGELVGFCFLPSISEKLGRKRSMYLATIFLCCVYILEAFSKWVDSFELFGIARFLRGMGEGLATDIQSMYLSECSPNQWRGMCGGLSEVFVQLGSIAGAVIALPAMLGTDDLWPLIFLFECVPLLVTWVALLFLYESPKFLLAKGHTQNAHRSLVFFQHSKVKESLSSIADEISAQEKEPSVLEVLRNPRLRKGLLLGASVWLIGTYSGVEVIDFFSTRLYVDVGIEHSTATYITICTFTLMLVAALCSSFVVDRIGRRPMLLMTSSGLALTNFLFMCFNLLYSNSPNAAYGYVCVLVQWVLLLLYVTGPAVLQWTIISEVVPQNARSTAIAISNTAIVFVLGINQLTFLPLNGLIGGYSFLFFVIPLTILSLIVYFIFPETKRRSTADIVRDFGDDESKRLLADDDNVKYYMS